MAEDKFKKKKELPPLDPWVPFMQQASKTLNPIFVCCFIDDHGVVQVKAGGKMLTVVGLIQSAVEFFRAQMFHDWNKNLDTNKASDKN